jgi:hypothetical protein
LLVKNEGCNDGFHSRYMHSREYTEMPVVFDNGSSGPVGNLGVFMKN